MEKYKQLSILFNAADNDTLSEGIKIHGLEQASLLVSANFAFLGYSVILE